MYETFEELGVVPQILKAVEDMGFEEPTPIQKAAIPAALAGKDLIGQAQTGTGKTAAFGIPVLQRIDLSRPAPQAVILSPTRELAVPCRSTAGRTSTASSGRCACIRRSSWPRRAVSWIT